jgi:hypothetical protein
MNRKPARGPSFGRLTCEKAYLFLKKLSFFAGLAIVSSFGQNGKSLAFCKKLSFF